jgi:hypothetical protein
MPGVALLVAAMQASALSVRCSDSLRERDTVLMKLMSLLMMPLARP